MSSLLSLLGKPPGLQKVSCCLKRSDQPATPSSESLGFCFSVDKSSAHIWWLKHIATNQHPKVRQSDSFGACLRFRWGRWVFPFQSSILVPWGWLTAPVRNETSPPGSSWQPGSSSNTAGVFPLAQKLQKPKIMALSKGCHSHEVVKKPSVAPLWVSFTSTSTRRTSLTVITRLLAVTSASDVSSSEIFFSVLLGFLMSFKVWDTTRSFGTNTLLPQKKHPPLTAYF